MKPVTDEPHPAQGDATTLAEHADAIRVLGKRVIGDVIEIGRRLTEAKGLAGHGGWLLWLQQELGWTARTAENYINVFKLAGKIENFSNLHLPISAFYLVAAPSTPVEARTELIERAAGGEGLPVAEVRRVIGEARGQKRPPPKKATAQATPAPEPPHQDVMGYSTGALDVRPVESAGQRQIKVSVRHHRTIKLPQCVVDDEGVAHVANKYDVLLVAWCDCAPDDQRRFLDKIGARLTASTIDAAPPPEAPPTETAPARLPEGHARAERGDRDWQAGILEVAAAMAEGRHRCGDDDRKFGHWLVENDADFYGDQDRAALVGMGQNLEITRVVLSETTHRPLHLIWREDIQPRISRSAAKHAPSASSPESSASAPTPDAASKPQPDPYPDLPACLVRAPATRH